MAKTKTYIEFLYGGMFSDVGAAREIDHRDPYQIKLPDGACGFRFYDRQVTMSDGEELVGKIHNNTGWYYEGKKASLDDVRKMNTNGRHDVLITNMECNHWEHVVMFKSGYAYMLNENDTVL